MYTKTGLENLIEDTFGSLKDYIESFYHHLGTELTEENKTDLAPFIAQAHEKKISTMDLVEIVKSSMV